VAGRKEIEAIAHLACLKIDESEIEGYKKHFNRVLEHFDDLQKLSTEGVTPMCVPHGQAPPLRADKVQTDLNVEQVLENAPEVKDGLFKVPPVG
jgi:aspartyl-tRNA(Asn)/glutamyl-tRNA(Gln) amidotransferase subunit C